MKEDKATNTLQQPAKIWNKSFISLMFGSFAMNMGLTMSNSLLAKYADSMGAPSSQIGILMGVYALSALFFKIFSAPSIDTFNKKYLSVISSIFFAITFIGFAVSKSIPSLIVFRLIQGVGMCFGTSVFLTLASEMLPKDKYSSGIGYFSLAQVLATAIGPAIGLYILSLTNYKVTYVINACVVLLAAVFISRIKYQFKKTKKLKIVLKNIIAKEALFTMLIMTFLVIGTSIVNSFLIVFAAKKGITEGIGFYFTISGITLLVSRPTIGRLTDRYGLVKVCLPALCCNIIGYFLISFSNSLLVFFAASFICALGYGACQPVLLALAMKCVPRNRRGAASCTAYIGMDFGNLMGPTIAGFVAQTFNYVFMWRIMTVPFLLAILTVFLFRNKIAQIENNFISIDHN